MTEAWVQAAFDHIRGDPRFAKAAQRVDIGILSILTDAPPESYGFLYVRIGDGELKELKTGHRYEEVAEGIETPEFVVSGDFKVFEQIHAGNLSERMALLRGKLHLTGSMRKALRYMGTLETLTSVLREVPSGAQDEGYSGLS